MFREVILRYPPSLKLPPSSRQTRLWRTSRTDKKLRNDKCSRSIFPHLFDDRQKGEETNQIF